MNMEQEQDEILHCEGCGVVLQMESPTEAGYVPEQALLKVPIICQRCFRMKNYNEASNVTVNPTDFLNIVSHIGKTNSLVVHIVDIFDFEGSLISGLQRFVGNNPILLAVNKMDLLPKVTNYNRVLNWVRKQLKENGLKVADIVLCSAKKNIGFDRLPERIETLRKGRDVYVVGATNVGKSTLINRLIHDYSDMEGELTTSQYPGTTLDIIQIPLDDNKAIIDTPGIVYDHRMTEVIDRSLLSLVMPDQPIKPIVFQLNEAQTLYVGGLARFDFVKGERQSFTIYLANRLKIHRTKLEKADDLYAEHLGELLQPPSKEQVENFPPLVKHTVKVQKGQQVEVLISGLGWIKANKGAGADLIIHAPKGIKVAIREPLI